MFEDRMGFQQELMTDDQDIRQGIRNWLERVLGYYGEKGGVDVEVIADQLLLTDETAEYLYNGFTPLELKYKTGTRPLLESVVAQTIDEQMTDFEKMRALMIRCRDNRDFARPSIRFDGGNEEELLKRGAIMCNEIHRVFLCLCQIAGLPGRLMGAHISGHMMSEIYLEESWMWVDCMKGMYCRKDDGTPASTRDLKQDPELFNRQAAEVWEDCRPVNLTGLPEMRDREVAFCQAKARTCYFHPREAIALGNYFVWDTLNYTYPWRTEPDDPCRLAQARIAEAVQRQKMNWPDFYSEPNLFNGELIVP